MTLFANSGPLSLVRYAGQPHLAMTAFINAYAMESAVLSGMTRNSQYLENWSINTTTNWLPFSVLGSARISQDTLSKMLLGGGYVPGGSVVTFPFDSRHAFMWLFTLFAILGK